MTRLCTCDQAREEISLPHTEECKFRLWWEAMEDRAESFDDLVRKEKREAHRFSRSEYEQEQRRKLDANTEIYLNLK